MRQSAGNSAKNTLAAIRFAQRETIVVAAAGWAARIRKPVLLKTASPTRQGVWAAPGDSHQVTKASIAAARRLRNAAPLRDSGEGIIRPSHIRRTFRHGNRAWRVAAPVAAFAPNRLHENRQHVSFEEAAWPGAERLPSSTVRAMKSLKREAPRGASQRRHGTSPGQFQTQNEMRSCVRKVRCRPPGSSNATPALVKRPSGMVTCAVSVTLKMTMKSKATPRSK